MRRVFSFSLLLLTLMSVGWAATAAAAPTGAGKQVVGYYIEWGLYGRGYTVKNIVSSGSADKLTVINYAFANVAPDAVTGKPVCQLFDPWADLGVAWDANTSVDGIPAALDWAGAHPLQIAGNFQQLRALKAMYPKLKILISLGGWTGSKYFSDAALPANRRAFVSSCIDMFIKGDLPMYWGAVGGPGAIAGIFDGIDIDWEYPGADGNPGNIIRPEDTQNFTALLAEFRRQLNLQQFGLLLTIAAPAGKAKIDKIQVDRIHHSLNWVNLMAYDYHGTWEATTNFNSPLYTSPKDPSIADKLSTNYSVNTYLNRGLPPKKLVVGVPFYGHGWSGVPDVNHGLYQSSTGAAPGTWEAGSEDFKALKILTTKGYTRYYDPQAKDAWLYSPTDQTFWSYDDAAVMAQRRAYVISKGLGGLMFWELSGDTADGELITALTGH